MIRRLAAAAIALLSATLPAQRECAGTTHYRWEEKVEAWGSHAQADTVTLAAILDDWPRPAIGKKADDFCIGRETGEKRRIVVSGYLWRVKRSDDDGDYHLELTASRSQFSERCLIAEIPEARWGKGFGRVRAALEKMVGGPVTDTRDLPKPLHVRLTGIAFWDGWHAGIDRPNSHGRCNARGIGVWEIHPVTRIARMPPL